jgi:methyl-accepting chemotaxis protein
MSWFTKHAPIRVKFTIMLIVHVVITSAVALATFLERGWSMPLAVALGGVAVTALFVLMSRVAICTPYVNTVVRMEGLAAGDLDTPIGYMDHRDCVGRMTQAMAVFRANALALREENGKALDTVVGALSKGLQALAAGQLNHRIAALPEGYEALRESFNQTMTELEGLMHQVRDSAAGVRTGAGEINSASHDLAQRTERQAASLAETAASMGEVTKAIGEAARAAGSAANGVSAVNAEALEGGRVVQSAVEAMAAIEKSASEIGQIINVIDGIAFQTNLLALNAGVEAARAGDAGRGFAVVASEVRALAQRCADSAKDIKGLIEASNAQVAGGVKLVGETGSILTRMVGKIGEVTAQVGSISRVTEEQAVRIEQINGAVGQMDMMTQQNAAMVEESTAAARSLASEADALSTLMARFDNGGASVAPVARSKPQVVAKAAPKAAPRRAVAGNTALAEDWSDF